jgi:hypothetical protein
VGHVDESTNGTSGSIGASLGASECVAPEEEPLLVSPPGESTVTSAPLPSPPLQLPPSPGSAQVAVSVQSLEPQPAAMTQAPVAVTMAIAHGRARI